MIKKVDQIKAVTPRECIRADILEAYNKGYELSELCGYEDIKNLPAKARAEAWRAKHQIERKIKHEIEKETGAEIKNFWGFDDFINIIAKAGKVYIKINFYKIEERKEYYKKGSI